MMARIGRKKAEELAAHYESIGNYKALDSLREDHPRLKFFRVKNADPGLHAKIKTLHMSSEKSESGLTGKQLRKESKALRHGLKYQPSKPAKKHVGRRAKAKILAATLRAAKAVQA